MRKLLRLDPVLTSDKIHCKGVEALWQQFFPYLIGKESLFRFLSENGI